MDRKSYHIVHINMRLAFQHVIHYLTLLYLSYSQKKLERIAIQFTHVPQLSRKLINVRFNRCIL
jgi:hypothetical protein